MTISPMNTPQPETTPQHTWGRGPNIVTKNALIKRLNRKLRHEGEMLHTARVWTTDLGDYYIVDIWTRGLIANHVDLEGLGRELGVLRPDEKMQASS